MQLPKCSCFAGFPIRERPDPICTKLRFMGINGLLRLVVDRAQRILLTLPAVFRDSGNGHIMFVTQLLHNLFQLICRDAAHIHPAAARNRAAVNLNPQPSSGGAGIFAVQLEKVAHLVQNQVIRVAFLDAVVFPNGFLLSRLVQIPARGNQDVDALFHLGPAKPLFLPFRVRTKLDASGIVFEEAVAAVQERPASATSAVFFFQELGPLFGRVFFLEEGHNPLFTVGKAAATGQRQRNILAGKRKGGDFFGLRPPVDGYNLLGLCRKKA